MLNFKTVSAALLISSCLMSHTFAMEEQEGESKTPISLASASSSATDEAEESWVFPMSSNFDGSLPSFMEFDQEGEFERYSFTLENAIAYEIKYTEGAKLILESIDEELKALRQKKRLDPKGRLWGLYYLNEYMTIVDKHSEDLKSKGINITAIPSSLILKKI